MNQNLKNLYIKTYGCQMNVYDSERIEELLVPMGYRLNPVVEEAHLLILNTCHIRAKAEEKLFSDLGRYRFFKEAKKDKGEEMLIVVAGCVGQALGQDIIKKAPVVDAVVGPQTYHHLPETIAKILREVEKQQPSDIKKKPSQGIIHTGFPKIDKFDTLILERQDKGASRFLSIQEGCDKFCRYCVVPYTRGAEYSRPVADVLEEADRLLDAGAIEITLLGQNVNAYHGQTKEGHTFGLGKLLFELAKKERLKRIRYTTSHPKDVDDALIAAHRDLPVVMPFLHLPVQSGSDRILSRMNRQYTAKHYLEIIEKLRKARPDIAFSSDFIVGYPSEEEIDFKATCDLVKEVRYAQAYSFQYSRRPGTPADIAKHQVEEAIKKERLLRLQDLLNKDQRAFNEASAGQIMEVLVEKQGKHENQWIGRSPFMQSICFTDETVKMGDLVKVELKKGLDNSVLGIKMAS